MAEDVKPEAKEKAPAKPKETAREKELEKQLALMQEQLMLLMRNVNQQPQPVVVVDDKAALEAAKKAKFEKWKTKVAKRHAARPERVPMFFFGDEDRYQGVIFASVNGKPVLIPRNKEVLVPYTIAKVLEEQRVQDEKSLERRKKMEAPADLPRT